MKLRRGLAAFSLAGDCLVVMPFRTAGGTAVLEGVAEKD